MLPEPLETFAKVARDEILLDFKIDSCIASTRITIEVMRRLKVKARPLAVEATVYNEGFHDAVTAEGWPDTSDTEAFHAWCDKHNAWSLGIDRSQSQGDMRWPGHLVALVGRSPYLVDAAADQMSRPKKGIEMPGVFVQPLYQTGFVTGQQPAIFTGEEDGKVKQVVVYRAFPDDRSYNTAPDWKEPNRFMPAVERIVKHLTQTT